MGNLMGLSGLGVICGGDGREKKDHGCPAASGRCADRPAAGGETAAPSSPALAHGVFARVCRPTGRLALCSSPSEGQSVRQRDDYLRAR